MDKEQWEAFYNRSDPGGKKFADTLLEIYDINSCLFHFLFERGQLYGIVMHLLFDKLGVHELEIDFETLQSFNGYMLEMIPNKELTKLSIKLTSPNAENRES